MPVRSLTSSVVKWPEADEVDVAVCRWARAAARSDARVTRIGYFGSYASGNWGVGSDVDLLVIVSSAEEPFTQRARHWNTLDLPVPADLLVYTEEEWTLMRERGRRITQEPIKWVYRRDCASAASDTR